MTHVKVELNEQFKKALDLLENTSKNVFITGRAGTGKSTLLTYFRNQTKKKIVVLAPTGVAAINVAGQTIHSFFRFKPDITLGKVKKIKPREDLEDIYKKLDAIVIDEISMVRADLLDCIDKFMRLNGKNPHLPFGGTQMVFIGDLYQLPPVVTGQEKEIFSSHYQSPYFFSSFVFFPLQTRLEGGDLFQMEFMELEKIYRQSDQYFISLLNAIRNNTVLDNEITAINTRFKPNFESPTGEKWITLTTTNQMAAEINDCELKKVDGEEYLFRGQLDGKFDLKSLPTELDLKVKVGAQIMLLNNDSLGRWVNGSLGVIKKINKNPEFNIFIIYAELANGELVDILPHEWDMYNFVYDRNSHNIRSEVVGSFAQYPLKLAWAITIHKSQGKTFDRVVIDIGRGTFSSGQLYVALSRCTSLEGIILRKKISKQNVWLDWKVVKFVTDFQYQKSNEAMPFDDKVVAIEEAIKNKSRLMITYLKREDEKSRRVFIPARMGEMEYMGKTFFGVEGYCLERKEVRVFRVDRILEMTVGLV